MISEGDRRRNMANGSVPDSLAAARRRAVAAAFAAGLLAAGCSTVDGVVQDIADAVFYDADDDTLLRATASDDEAPYRSLHEVPDETPDVSSAEERAVVAAGLIAERAAARRRSAALRDPGARDGAADPERRAPDEPRPAGADPVADAPADEMAAFKSHFDERFDASGGVLGTAPETRPAPGRTAAAGPETPETRAAERDPAGVVLHLGTAYFAQGSARLRPDDRALVKEAARLQRDRSARLRVVGHASRWTADMPPVRRKVLNLNLSLDRASAVARALVAEGVPAGALSIEGAAASRPVADEDTPGNEALNRRAEIFIEY